MKKKSIAKDLLRLTLLLGTLAAIVLIANVAFGQPGPPPTGGPSGGPPCWPPPCIPIDGGIGFLVAAGLIYGGKKSLDLMRGKKH